MAATTMARPVPGMPPRPPERRTSSWVLAVLAAIAVLAVVALLIGLALSRNNGGGTQTPPTVAMPKITGLSEDEAKTALAKLNFSSVTAGTPVQTDKCDPPTVQVQSPSAGTQVRIDQPVTYQMCKSPDKVTVPSDLIGATRDQASNTLTKAGLQPDFKNVDSDKPQGTVVAVDKAGQQVDPGTTIKVSISRGNLVTVPGVLGKTQEEAVAALQAAGLTANITKGSPSPNAGVVESQNPSEGKKIARGKSVTIAITQSEPSTGPTPSDSSSPPAGGTGGGGNLVTGLLN
jgi:serine/threonine-protein kinase